MSDNESEEIESIATKLQHHIGNHNYHYNQHQPLVKVAVIEKVSKLQDLMCNQQIIINISQWFINIPLPRGQILKEEFATRKNNQQPTITVDDVKQSINSTTTTTTTTTASTSKQSSLECSQEQFKLERTKIMTIVIKYVTAKSIILSHQIQVEMLNKMNYHWINSC